MRGRLSRVETERAMHLDKKGRIWDREKDRGRDTVEVVCWCGQLDMDFLICPNRICPMQTFLPYNRPNTGVVTARRQHGTSTQRWHHCCLCVWKRAIVHASVWRGRGRECNNKTGSQNVCKSCRQKCQIKFVVFVSDFHLLPNSSCDAFCCGRTTFRWQLWCNSDTTVLFPSKWNAYFHWNSRKPAKKMQMTACFHPLPFCEY